MQARAPRASFARKAVVAPWLKARNSRVSTLTAGTAKRLAPHSLAMNRSSSIEDAQLQLDRRRTWADNAIHGKLTCIISMKASQLVMLKARRPEGQRQVGTRNQPRKTESC